MPNRKSNPAQPVHNPAAELTHATVSIFFQHQNADDLDHDLWSMLMHTIEGGADNMTISDAAFTYRRTSILLRQLQSLV